MILMIMQNKQKLQLKTIVFRLLIIKIIQQIRIRIEHFTNLKMHPNDDNFLLNVIQYFA